MLVNPKQDKSKKINEKKKEKEMKENWSYQYQESKWGFHFRSFGH